MAVYDHPQVRIAPPLLFLGILIAAIALNLLVPLPAPWPAAMRSAGIILLLAGFLLAAWAFSRLAGAGTSPDPGHAATTLLTQGPYRVSRNPIYLGFAFVFLGSTLLVGTLWGLVLSPILIRMVTRLVIDPEEKHLTARFEQRYTDYLARVRRWL